MGIPKIVPPSASIRVVNSHVFSTVARRGARFGLPLPKTGHVPPTRFFTFLTVFSSVDRAGLLHPAANHGIHRVVCGLRPRGPRQNFLDAKPFEVFPSPVAFLSLKNLPP
jgi:hypothetical protein